MEVISAVAGGVSLLRHLGAAAGKLIGGGASKALPVAVPAGAAADIGTADTIPPELADTAPGPVRAVGKNELTGAGPSRSLAATKAEAGYNAYVQRWTEHFATLMRQSQAEIHALSDAGKSINPVLERIWDETDKAIGARPLLGD